VSRSKVTYKMTAITPELAAAWLENRNTHNRPLRDYRIAELARDMSAGRWHDTGEPIKFDYNDALLDGQHRLGAIVASGVTIEMLVIWGLQPETQDYMDIGLKRSVADSLVLEGKIKVRHAAVAAIARQMLALEAGAVGSNDAKKRPTHAEVLDFVRNDPEGLEEAAYVQHKARDAGLRGGMVYGLAYYMLSKVDADDAEQFFKHLIDGQGLLAGSPIYALRTKLIKDPPDRASRSVRHELFYFIKAWNAYRRNQSIVVLRWARGEDYPEAV
jgi:hypothetical protein